VLATPPLADASILYDPHRCRGRRGLSQIHPRQTLNYAEFVKTIATNSGFVKLEIQAMIRKD
jgi:hypothetical protein